LALPKPSPSTPGRALLEWARKSFARSWTELAAAVSLVELLFAGQGRLAVLARETAAAPARLVVLAGVQAAGPSCCRPGQLLSPTFWVRSPRWPMALFPAGASHLDAVGLSPLRSRPVGWIGASMGECGWSGGWPPQTRRIRRLLLWAPAGSPGDRSHCPAARRSRRVFLSGCRAPRLCRQASQDPEPGWGGRRGRLAVYASGWAVRCELLPRSGFRGCGSPLQRAAVLWEPTPDLRPP